MIYESILEQLSTQRCKLTLQRRELLKILIRAKTPLAAREIYDRMLKKYPHMSFDTVYRNLNLLQDLHIVNRLDFQEGRSRYELNRSQDHHHHLVCLKCGGTWKLKACPLEGLNINNTVPEDFKVTTHRFEVFGYCRQCRKELST